MNAEKELRKLGIVAALLVAQAALATEMGYDTLIAHRGESKDAPENTLPAYKMAVERGFGFECDIYMSKDGRLYTFHDSDLKRTSGGKNEKRCTEASWEDEVSKLNVGGWGQWAGSKFDPTRPALLEEVLALARPGRKIYVEVKGGDSAAKWVPKIKETFAKEPKATPETVLFISFHRKTCAELKRLMPEYKVFWLTGKGKADEIIGVLKKLGVDGVDLHYKSEWWTEESIKQIRDAGFEVHFWTIDDYKTAKEALSRGGQTVTTNCAKKLLDENNSSGNGF